MIPVKQSLDSTIFKLLLKKEEDLLKIAYAKIWSSISVVRPRFEDSQF
jgi:hypothetical protein